MLSHEGKDRSFLANATLAVALSGVAGAVNATGFFAVGTYTSHVTGNLARVGDEIAQGNAGLALRFFVLVVAFLAGAMTATVLVETARRAGGRGHYKSALLLETGLLASVALISAGVGPMPGSLALILTAALCFAMGLQNALVTKISGAVVRTTHLTGITTDFGIEAVRLWYWFRERSAGLGLLGKLKLVRTSWRDTEAHKAWLHFAIFSSFFSGAIVGPVLYLEHGHVAMLMPCGVLLLLVGQDLLSARRRVAAGPAARIAR
jgi:uncharacterized membrane protein YoaK (UPF0700 family)